MTKGKLPLIDLLYSAVMEYQLLDEIVIGKGDFRILIARLDFVVYIFVEDDIGLHCVEFSESVLDIKERAKYWKAKLESGILEVLTYKIPKTHVANTPPDALRFTQRTLIPKKEK